MDVTFVLARTLNGAPQVSRDNYLLPGQMFAVREVLGVVRGEIRGGSLRVTLPRVPLVVDLSGIGLTLPLSDVRIEVPITYDRLSGGNAGGRMRVAEFVEAADRLGFGAVLLSLTDEPGVTDLDYARYSVSLDGTTFEKTGCSAISAGFSFEAIDVRLQ